MEPSLSSKNSTALPIAIVIGFGMIALAVYFTGGRETKEVAAPQADAETITSSTPRQIDDSDYIRGNPNAPILMVEYSDYDCPFCKQYHETLNQIMDEYGVSGRVAWVYRQFPIAQLHPNSPKISEAALCVGDIGGDQAFWSFTDLVFEEREIEEQTNITKLPDYAVESGVSKEAYNTCVNSGKMTQKVTESMQDAFNIGARGTPYTILIVGNQQAVIDGAQPYDIVKGIIDNLLQQLDGTFDPATVPVNPEVESTP